jgi:hypothetical protein
VGCLLSCICSPGSSSGRSSGPWPGGEPSGGLLSLGDGSPRKARPPNQHLQRTGHASEGCRYSAPCLREPAAGPGRHAILRATHCCGEGPMICHVCQEQAVGQCKSCGKFYCKQHGDFYCVQCAHSVTSRPSPAAFDIQNPGPERLAIGAGCHACQKPAQYACRGCGRLCCVEHQTTSGWVGGPFCNACYDSVVGRQVVGCLLATPFLLFALFAFAQGCR